MAESERSLTEVEFPGPPAVSIDARSPKRLSRLHLAAWALGLLVFFGPVAAFSFFLKLKGLGAAASELGCLAVTFCVIAGLSVGLDLGLRRFSRWPGALSFLLLCMLVGAALLAVLAHDVRVLRVKELRFRSDLQVAKVDQLMRTPITDADFDRAVDEARTEVRQAAANMRKRDATYLLAEFDTRMSIETFMWRRSPSMRAYRSLGATDVGEIEDDADIEFRLRLLRDARTELARVNEFAIDCEKDLPRRLRGDGVDPDDVAVELSELKRKLEGESDLRKFADDGVQIRIEYWQVLLDSWGSWTRGDHVVLFTGPRGQEWQRRFNEAGRKLTRYLEEEKVRLHGASAARK